MARSVYSLACTVTALAGVLLTPEPAAAQDESSEGVLSEVTVTAQFRKENLQTTPVAITAVNAEMLEARSQTSVQQIANQAPNVTLKPAGTSNGPSLIGFIRGIGQTDFNFAREPGVGMYVDDVYYSTLTGSVLDLLDLDRVEVLRGPQGTLAGKNSIGGAIKLFSKRPQGTNDGYVQAVYGGLDRVEVRASGDFSLVPDRLFVRIAGVSKHQDGYVDRVDYGCTHPGSGVPTFITGAGCKLGTEGGISYTAARASLRWLASEAVEVNLIADITNDTSESPANVLAAAVGTSPLATGFDANGQSVSLLGSTAAIPYGCLFVAFGANSCDPNKPNNKFLNYSTYLDPRTSTNSAVFDGGTRWGGVSVPAVSTLQARGISATVDWEITDRLSLTSITAYRKYDSLFGDDADGSPVAVQLLLQHLTHDQKSQELRLNGAFGSVLDWTLGGFYFDQNSSEDARVDLAYSGLDFIHGPDDTPAKTWAAFLHTSWHLTDRMNLGVGTRYSDESKTYRFARHSPDGTVPAACTIPGPSFLPGQPWNCALFGDDGVSSTFSGTRSDYRAALDYQWTPTFMTYGQFSTGYKGGGVNPRPFYPSQILTFRPETLDAYELGFKSELLDRRMRLNVSVFHNEYKDIQLTLSECSALAGAGFGSPCALPANAGDAEVRGAELETEIYPLPGLRLDAALSYLDFEYTRVDPATGVTSNDITPYTPERKWSAGAQYEITVGQAGSLTPRLDASYQSTIYTSSTNRPTNRIDAYTVVNARVTWKSSTGDWQIALEGTNLTNEYYFLTKSDLSATGAGYVAAQPALPRQWAMTIKRQFR